MRQSVKPFFFSLSAFLSRGPLVLVVLAIYLQKILSGSVLRCGPTSHHERRSAAGGGEPGAHASSQRRGPARRRVLVLHTGKINLCFGLDFFLQNYTNNNVYLILFLPLQIDY